MIKTTLYADRTYYFDVYKGKKFVGEDVEEYLKLAQEKIDSITYNRIVARGFDNLTEFQQNNIKKAVCNQAEYIYENGYDDENTGDIASYSVLDISVTTNTSGNKSQASMAHMSARAYSLIEQTGLSGRRF